MSSTARLANPTAATRTVLLLSIAAAASAAAVALARKRRHATDITLAAKKVVNNNSGNRTLLAIDIGSSSVRCSAYTIGSPPVLVPGCDIQIKHVIVTEANGVADAEEVIDLVDEAVDRCFR